MGSKQTWFTIIQISLLEEISAPFINDSLKFANTYH